RFGRIEAIISSLQPSDSDHPNKQIGDALKISRLLRHNKLGVYYSQDRSNMLLELQRQLKNHFVVGFVPFGGHFDDAMHPLLQELYQLEKSVVMNMNGESVWVITSIGLVIADLPQ
ncbi:33897_t:CDS:2, partial [Racocetra persica]